MCIPRHYAMVGIELALLLALGLATPGARGSDDDGSAPVSSAGRSDGVSGDAARMIRQEATVAAPLADVWHAWTTPEGVNSFFGADADIELVVGGKYEIYFSLDAPAGQRGSEGCRVLSFLPGKMLSFSWNAPPKFAAVRKERTQVVMLFNELAPTVTRVRLRHHGWQEGEEWDQVFDYFSRAWPSVFASFEKRFAQPEAEQTADSPGAAEQESARALKQYIYFIQPARTTFHEDSTEAERALVGQHFAYLVERHQQGKLILAGRCQDAKGPGVVIIEAQDEASARAFMENDPAMKAGVFVAESFHPYRVALLGRH